MLPNNRLPGFEGEWSTVKLGDLGDTYGGLTGKTKEDFGSGEPYITYMSVFADGAIIPDKFDYVKLKEGEKQHSVEYGDILFTTSSETPEEVGMASVMLERLPFKVYLNSFCFGFRLSSLDFLIPEYAKYYMRSEGIRRAIANLAQGATRYNLSKKQLLKISLYLPSISEQKKIAQILSTWDNAISATERLLDNSQQRKKALMQQLLTGKKRLPGFEGEWEERVVGDDFDVRSSKRVLQEDWKTEGIPFFRTRELVSLSKNEPFRSEIFISEKLYEEISKKYGTPKEGDFLVSGVGTLGISYQVKARDVFYFKDGNVLWFKTKNMINSDFFNYCFHSVYFQNQINAQAAITTVGTFTIQNAKKIKFFCPPTLDEQRKIATILTTADQEIDALQKRLDHLKLEKKALMQQLLTGKRRVLVDTAA
ncbi:restriction endonuclease subunit S [Morganella morganii]|uniref:restriction endonuclease subunit S n=1 Tax=Morganella morganii TaxID=582 RepID=UPI00339BCFEC